MRVAPHHDSPTDKSTSEGWKTVSHGLVTDNECNTLLHNKRGNRMNYILTHNLINEREAKTRTHEQEKMYPHYFELLDDDNELYFMGYSACDSSFAPLDDVGESYGCTTIRYRGANGKMETL